MEKVKQRQAAKACVLVCTCMGLLVLLYYRDFYFFQQEELASLHQDLVSYFPIEITRTNFKHYISY